jgi:cytochrome c556
MSLIGLLSFAASAAVLADAAEDAIKYRKGVFQVVKWNFGPMGAMIKGEMPYDKDGFARRAEAVATMSKMALEGFPKGSDMGADTTAKPNIWEEWDNFKAGMEKFEAASAKLAEVSKSGEMDAIKAQFGETAKTCKGCHDHFRQE